MLALVSKRLFVLVLTACLIPGRQIAAQTIDALSPQVKRYVSVSTPRTVLTHVEVIDGTGAPPVADQNITIEAGKITAISPGRDLPASEGTTILNLRGHSVLPGIVGMHDHLFAFMRPNLAADGTFDAPAMFAQMTFSAPRLYLANGVTTARTAASASPYADIRLKQAIEGGTFPGPHLDVTGPFLEGKSENPYIQIYQLTGPDDARQTVAYWAERGVTSFKAYAHITREELKAAADEAHKHGSRITGHLCSVTYEEAAELGIDNIEHGFLANTAQDPGKKPDACSASGGDYTLEHTVPGSPEAEQLFAILIKHHIAITSTLVSSANGLPTFGTNAESQPALRPAVRDAMAPALQQAYDDWLKRPPSKRNVAFFLRREMDLERAFVAAGGLLLAGPDPGGIAGNLPGFGDHRQVELLVEAGFTPVQAIRIATLNGAIFLGREKQIGSVAVRKNADLLVVKGDPVSRIADIEDVEIVFKDGVGYDPKKLLDSVKGRYGEY